MGMREMRHALMVTQIADLSSLKKPVGKGGIRSDRRICGS